MSLIPRIFQSSDPGAPALTGQAGSLISVLRAILVTGYGTAPTAVAPLGWTEPFTGTNKAVFRNNPTSGSGVYLRVDDSAGTTGGAKSGVLRMFDAMTDVDTGSNPSPTTTQLASGVAWIKSATADATSRPWRAIGTERDLYFFTALSGVAGGYAPWASFDLRSRMANDKYNHLLCGEPDPNRTPGNGLRPGLYPRGMLQNAVSTSDNATYIQRPRTLLVGGTQVNFVRPSVESSDPQLYGTGGFAYPDPVGNALLAERIAVREASMALRGYAPGVYAPLHARPLAEGVHENLLPGVSSALVWNITALTTSSSATFNGQLIFDLGTEW